MMRACPRLTWLVVVSLAASCTYRIPEGTLACVADDACPPGWSCIERLCYGAPRDAGSAVDAAMDAGRDGAPDGSVPACALDAGGTDVDCDGVAPPDDCDDADPEVRPGADEVCTVSASGALARDEDCDQSIDEGCPWHFGTPHFITDTFLLGTRAVSPRHSRDGRSLYYAAQHPSGAFVPLVAVRGSTAARFGPAGEVAGDWAGQDIASIVVSADGLEALLQLQVAAGRYEIHHARRSSPIAPFGAPSRVSDQTLVNPAFSEDGLEAYAAGSTGLFVSARGSRADPFPRFNALMIPGRSGADGSPQQLGTGLLFLRPGDGLVFAPRLGPTVFDTPRPLGIGFAVEHMSYDPRERELVFTSAAPWTPIAAGATGLWRAEVCRDGPCPDRSVACAAPAIRSADGTHCYEPTSGADFDAARAGCGETREAHMVSIHSFAEQDTVFALAGSIWVGIVEGSPTWTSGERFTNARWQPGHPVGGGGCVALNGLGNLEEVPRPCAGPLPTVCERELWPTW